MAAFIDQGKPRTFPRWYGYYCGWYMLLDLPTCMLYFLKTGPIAYNGLLTFWLALALFGTWIALTPYLILKAIKEEERPIVAFLSATPDSALDSVDR